MTSTPAASSGSVVIDANVLIAFCSKEKDKFTKAQSALADYANRGCCSTLLELWWVKCYMSFVGSCKTGL